MKPLPVEQMRRLLRYEPETGRLFWKERSEKDQIGAALWNAKYAGMEAFRTAGQNGRKTGTFLGGKYQTPRVIWAIVNGESVFGEIDHINGDPSDNRLCNLREATKSQNQHNKAKYSNNSSGFKGVSAHKDSGRWQARIAAHGRRHWLGKFRTPEAAHAAYCAAAERLHGTFARTS